jgi:hypothetical protein
LTNLGTFETSTRWALETSWIVALQIHKTQSYTIPRPTLLVLSASGFRDRCVGGPLEWASVRRLSTSTVDSDGRNEGDAPGEDWRSGLGRDSALVWSRTDRSGG